ncbi:MAG: ArgR family transcriptional regulator, partial [Paludibacteraceae bacterium]|nr:ArgR family transcriptional regulator [Paludibacteraceae bacterium]
MRNKADRMKLIRQFCIENNVSSQEELLNLLKDNGFILTQATLSRDL